MRCRIFLAAARMWRAPSLEREQCRLPPLREKKENIKRGHIKEFSAQITGAELFIIFRNAGNAVCCRLFK